MSESKEEYLLEFHLESIEAGGPDLVECDSYEMVGDNNQTWDVSISAFCGEPLGRILVQVEEIEHLKSERDALIERAQVAEASGEEIEGKVVDSHYEWLRAAEERDALAAYAEQIKPLAERCADELAWMIDRHNTQSAEDGSWEYDHQTPHELMIAVRANSATSLARLKAQWQAEALEEAARVSGEHWLSARAARIRRQAEADQ